MSSILTNTSAMVALQTLKSTNKGMGQIQNQISTGMKVSNAKDNASTWAIAQTMRSDVGGFKSIKSGLDIAGATVNVARNAAESISDMMSEIKKKIVEAQSDSVDRGKIQTDIAEMRDQISSIVGTAQFNGVNMLNAQSTEGLKVLSSLDRGATGNVSAGEISVSRNDLRATGYTAATDSTYLAAADGDDGAEPPVPTGHADVTVTAASLKEGDVIRIGRTDGSFAQYTVAEGDLDETAADQNANIATKLRTALTEAGFKVSTGTDAVVTVEDTVAADLQFQVFSVEADADDRGGMARLGMIDVSTKLGASAALSDIEDLLKSATSAAAAFGSAQQRIEIQQEFMGKLIDSMNTGIGAMVDADMEEASARLQALQVQQQLGVQALSIANQAPQSVLSLFR